MYERWPLAEDVATGTLTLETLVPGGERLPQVAGVEVVAGICVTNLVVVIGRAFMRSSNVIVTW